MMYKLAVPFILLISLVSFVTNRNVLYKNEKVEIYMEKGGVRIKYFVENFENVESLDIAYVFYEENKIFLGTEWLTNNEELISKYKEKYMRLAIVKNKKNIEIDRNNYKIVEVNKNGKIHFYYHNVIVSGNHSFTNSKNRNKLNDSMWHFVGSTRFLLDIKINNKQVLSQNFYL